MGLGLERPVSGTGGVLEEEEAVVFWVARWTGGPLPLPKVELPLAWKSWKIRRAMNSHIPSGYAAVGDVWNWPSLFRPIILCLWTWPQCRGSGPT